MERSKGLAAAGPSLDGDTLERFIEADICAAIERRFGAHFFLL
jgi:hypothetical protein